MSLTVSLSSVQKSIKKKDRYKSYGVASIPYRGTFLKYVKKISFIHFDNEIVIVIQPLI